MAEVVNSDTQLKILPCPQGKPTLWWRLTQLSGHRCPQIWKKTFSDEDKQTANDGSTVEIKLNARAVGGTGPEQARH